ncbi:MAG: two component transcriptional regulator, LuxR family [Chitinophagaceae bacterium]|nr:two component transcriptional regulator, LuxR family [Chitinophagaceae bacterium]
MIRIIIADDHEIFRDGLKSVLAKQKDITIIDEASNGADLVGKVKQQTPDVVLTDIVMPGTDGIWATKEIKKNNPGVKVLALSMFDQEDYVIEMLEAGALGYLVKNAGKQEIIDAIHFASRDIPYFCSLSSQKLVRMIGKSDYNPYPSVKKIELSEKEVTIVKLLCEQKTNKQIGEELCMSPRTVEGYRQRLEAKTGAKNTIGIVIYAIKNGIYTI